MVFFPSELEERLIDNVPQDDTYTLKSCSLVCRSWRLRSQYRLFNKTFSFVPAAPDTIERRPSGIPVVTRLKRFLKVCRSSPAITNAVKGLRLPIPGVLHKRLKYPFTNLRILEVVGAFDAIFGTTSTRSLTNIIKSNPKLAQLAFERLHIEEEALLRVFRAAGSFSLNNPSSSSLRVLAFRNCSFKQAERPPHIPHTFEFHNLALSLCDVHAFEQFTRSFQLPSVDALVAFINRSCNDIRYISISGFNCQSNPPPFENDMALSFFQRINFKEMQSLAELDLSSSTTGSHVIKYLIEELTRSPKIPLERCHIKLGFRGENRDTDMLLSNFATSKGDTLKLMELSGGRTTTGVIRMALPRTSRFDVVRFSK